MAADEKTAMRDLVLRGGPWSQDERRAILDYCQADVDALAALLPRMLPGILGRQRDARIALGQALLRGRYMAAAARMEWAGVPIDTAMLGRLRAGWGGIKARLVAEVDARYGVYEGTTFKADRFAAYLVAEGIPWPRLASGALALDDDTFRDMAKTYPALQPLRELRHALGELRLEALAVGADGRNRCLLSAFRSRTGRNQPSNSKFIFGPATWLRSLIRPEPGMALAYVDFSSQEMGIAAALSGDPALLEALPLGRRLPELRQAGGPGAAGRDQGQPRRGARPLQGGGAGHALRHGAGDPGPPHRPAALRGPGAAAAAPGDLPAVLALVGGGGGELRADAADRDRVRLALARRAGVEPALA